jgi:hypothetical protein
LVTCLGRECGDEFWKVGHIDDVNRGNELTWSCWLTGEAGTREEWNQSKDDMIPPPLRRLQPNLDAIAVRSGGGEVKPRSC